MIASFDGLERERERTKGTSANCFWLKVIYSFFSLSFHCFIEKVCDCSELHSGVSLPAGRAPCKWSEFPVAAKLLWTTWHKMGTVLLHIQAAPSNALWLHKCEDARGKTSEGYLGFEGIHGNSFSLGVRWLPIAELALSVPPSFFGSLTFSLFSFLDIWWHLSKVCCPSHIKSSDSLASCGVEEAITCFPGGLGHIFPCINSDQQLPASELAGFISWRSTGWGQLFVELQKSIYTF